QRRQEVEKEYTVLLYVGDNLRDFDERFRCRKLDPKAAPEELEQAIRERKDEVDRTRAAWGEKWIVLPNPAYGEWMKPLGQGRKDLDRLAPAARGKKPPRSGKGGRRGPTRLFRIVKSKATSTVRDDS